MSKERTQELEDVHSMMKSESGRRVTFRLLEKAGIHSTSYNPDAPREHIFFREGQRNLGLWLLSEVQEVCPQLYLRMLEENNNVD